MFHSALLLLLFLLKTLSFATTRVGVYAAIPRGGKKKGQASPTQPKLTDYRFRREAKQANEDNMAAVAAEEAEEASGEGELVGENEGAILTALSSMKK